MTSGQSSVDAFQDFDIIVSGLSEQTNYPYIYCYAEDAFGSEGKAPQAAASALVLGHLRRRAEDETDGGSSGPGSAPNKMMWDDVATQRNLDMSCVRVENLIGSKLDQLDQM